MNPFIFVISLPGSARRAGMTKQLENWQGEWRFVDAVDGRALTAQGLSAVYDETAAIRRIGRALAPAEIGCALSHRKVYAEILARDLDRAIVLEDDAILGETFQEFVRHDPGIAFDVISLYTSRGIVRRRATKHVGSVALYRAENTVTNTVGYLVSREGARKLHDASAVVRDVADWPIYPDHMAFYVAKPFPVVHEDADSTIEAARMALHKPKETRHRRLARLTDGNLGYITIPLYLKYWLYRRYYDGPYNYFWREILYELKMMMPLYLRLDS